MKCTIIISFDLFKFGTAIKTIKKNHKNLFYYQASCDNEAHKGEYNSDNEMNDRPVLYCYQSIDKQYFYEKETERLKNIKKINAFKNLKQESELFVRLLLGQNNVNHPTNALAQFVRKINSNVKACSF